MADRDGIDWATDTMLACNDRLEVANNNLANSSSRDFHTVLSRIIMTPAGLRAIHTQSTGSGPQRETDRQLDLAIDGKGSFLVSDSNSPSGIIESRTGAFNRDKDGFIVDASGRKLLGEHGPVRVGEDVHIHADGTIFEGSKPVDKIRLPQGSQIRSGFLEISDVDTAQIMINVIDAQRSFETAEKAMSSIDQARQKSADEVARLK